MDSAEFDVYVCYRPATGSELAKTVCDGLRRRGFRVYADDGNPADIERVRAVIADTPDFVLLLAPNSLDDCADPADRMRLEIEHALATGRHVVPVWLAEHGRPQAGTFPPSFSALLRRQGVGYASHAQAESLARIAHMLSSDASVDERRLMRSAKWIGTAVGVLFLVLLSIPVTRTVTRMLTAQRLDVRPLPPIALYWSAFGQRAVDGTWVEFPVADGAPLGRGDQFRVVFSPSQDGFAYVIVQDVRGDVSVLFPRAGESESRVRAGELYQVPSGGGWASVEGPEAASIYIVSSYDSIENLEELHEGRDGALEVSARRGLLESAIAGLLDGRHALSGPRIRSRAGRPVVQSIEQPALVLSASSRLSDGAVVTHQLVRQPGLLSAVAEIHFRNGRPTPVPEPPSLAPGR